MTSIKINKNIRGKLSLNYNEQHGLENIINELTDKYPLIKQVIIYGSRARGDFIEDSDVDLLFIMDENVTRKIKTQMSDIIYKHELSNDITVSAIFISELEFESNYNTFFLSVKKEGLVIWSRE